MGGLTATDGACRRQPTRLPAATGASSLAGTSRVHELLRQINERPDQSYGDHTPAVDELVDQGVAVIPPLLPLMLSKDWWTRMRAETALAGTVVRAYGFVVGRDRPSPVAEERFRARWDVLGDLRSEAGDASRRRAVQLWSEWVRAGCSP